MSENSTKREVHCQYCIYGNETTIAEIAKLASDPRALVRYPSRELKHKEDEVSFWRIVAAGDPQQAISTIRDNVIELRKRIRDTDALVNVTACLEIYIYTDNPQDGVVMQGPLLRMALEVADEVQVAVCQVSEW